MSYKAATHVYDNPRALTSDVDLRLTTIRFQVAFIVLREPAGALNKERCLDRGVGITFTRPSQIKSARNIHRDTEYFVVGFR